MTDKIEIKLEKEYQKATAAHRKAWKELMKIPFKFGKDLSKSKHRQVLRLLKKRESAKEALDSYRKEIK